MLLRCCLIHYNHHYIEIHFTLSLFVSMSTPNSMYVWASLVKENHKSKIGLLPSKKMLLFTLMSDF